jgi:hypothetical protein
MQQAKVPMKIELGQLRSFMSFRPRGAKLSRRQAILKLCRQHPAECAGRDCPPRRPISFGQLIRLKHPVL